MHNPLKPVAGSLKFVYREHILKSPEEINNLMFENTEHSLQQLTFTGKTESGVSCQVKSKPPLAFHWNP